jgi:hypothetical protein
MIKIPAENPPELCAFGPGFAMYRLEPPPGFPHVDSPLAGMFREWEATPSGLFPAEERATLLVSLATTITRASYHYQRFGFILGLLNERRRLSGGASGDTLGRFSVFEASSMLGAIRGAIDEIVYLAARMSGATEADADRWQAYKLVTQSPPAHQLVPAVLLLRVRAAWFLETNDYRNALTHRGSRNPIGGGYYPRNDALPEARDPGMNLFLVPDRASTENHARPHLWTYCDGLRLEDLVERIYTGFEELLHAVGPAWGFVLPPDGTMPIHQRPNIVARIARPVLTWMHGTFYAGIFTTEEHARRFLAKCFPNDTNVEPVPVYHCLLGTDPRFILNFSSGERLGAELRKLGVQGGDIKLAVDPSYNPRTAGIAYKHEAGSIPISYLLAAGEAGVNVDLLAETFPGHEVVYVIRNAHQEVPLAFNVYTGS